MRVRPDMVGIAAAALLAIGLAGTALAGGMLDVGDEAPPFMLYAYNDVVAKEASGSTSPGLGTFLGISPERPKQAVLLVFLPEGAVADMESLAKLQRKYANKGDGLQVMVVGIADEAIEMNDAIATAKGVNYPVLRDRFLIVSDRYGVERAQAPAAFLLVGEPPDVELTAREQNALDEAAHKTHLDWVVKIRGRWTGGLAVQEDAIARSVEAYLKK